MNSLSTILDVLYSRTKFQACLGENEDTSYILGYTQAIRDIASLTNTEVKYIEMEEVTKRLNEIEKENDTSL